MATISACLVVYNEEKVIERCLKSINSLVDEIIIVHDGPCSDQTLEIVKKFTDRIYIREYIGEAEPHRAFSFEQARCEWILQIDADEYLSSEDLYILKSSVEETEVDALILKWELWNGRSPVHFKGLEKACLFRKERMHYCGVPHESVYVDGKMQRVDIFLHHKPIYGNTKWRPFIKKIKKWAPIHAQYFFPELVEYRCFNATPERWIIFSDRVKKHIIFSTLFLPIKMCLGQLKNGQFTSLVGIITACRLYVYYFFVYWHVWKLKNNTKRI